MFINCLQLEAYRVITVSYTHLDVYKRQVEGIPQAPMNAEFHSAAVRSVNAFVIHNNKEKSNG